MPFSALCSGKSWSLGRTFLAIPRPPGILRERFQGVRGPLEVIDVHSMLDGGPFFNCTSALTRYRRMSTRIQPC